MKLVENLFKKKREIEDNYYKNEEKKLTDKVSRAEEVYIKKQRINTLKQKLSSFEPKTSLKQPQKAGWGMQFIQNAGKVSLTGTKTATTKKKAKKKPQSSMFGGFQMGRI